MAHARRKIHDVHARTPTDITTEVLRRIGELYAIEAEIRGSPAEKRLSARTVKTVPRMQSLYEWIQLSPSSSIASCADVRWILPSLSAGQMKRPRSRRLTNRQRPSSSAHNIFIKLPR